MGLCQAPNRLKSLILILALILIRMQCLGAIAMPQ